MEIGMTGKFLIIDEDKILLISIHIIICDKYLHTFLVKLILFYKNLKEPLCGFSQ